MVTLPWLILFAPFVSMILICLFFLKSPRLAGKIALLGILISFGASFVLFLHSLTQSSQLPLEISFSWFKAADLTVAFGFLIDPLSIVMLLVVTGVGSCIFLYSIGYMEGDPSFGRYFASLALFAFSMIGIVLSNNFLMLFVFWELVAVSSYLLIGFWYEKPAAADAGNKAFIVNRLADFGFVLGILTIWMLSGAGGHERTFYFSKLSTLIPQGLASGLFSRETMILAAALVFCGVMGKSAQFPLYIWLPDAMEGPTPVSALIHAATMVAAGVYLLSRTFFLVSGIAEILQAIAVIGTLTALLAALLAMVQNDLKKILAYSTISQLGFMVLALGLGSSHTAMYHLTTHAFFKALLFLGAGAMIHSLRTQDIWEMGGIIKSMPVTAVTFLIGTLALCGMWPLSGFFSKDEILTLAYEHAPLLYGTALFTAGLTAFYMSRAVWVAVLGSPRITKHSSGHPHEAPGIMKWPLVALAFFSIAGGFMGIPQFLSGKEAVHEPLNMTVALSSTVAALIGLIAGTALYTLNRSKEEPLKKILGLFYTLLQKKYYLDDLFSSLANLFQKALAKVLFWFDSHVVIEKGVNGAAGLTADFGKGVRRAQSGNVQLYAMTFSFGVIALLFFILTRS